ncbi:FtsW/RodA/SpoVE family cell cycle protein [Romboutsia timonensis]|uniref:FtsW/RodA/SpoVE family cell cycle protein n=1 Tax=Romboutsia timonensis TaxID=1776391 RepID=UPI002A761064|nr:FtsW/RodA/SpoVE family cell cycle protein [Romboutsia timonensis]MDY3001025.1 FtsW/RodA/SpoVE family cell cycle protein [Romboutsia timonensis]MDY3958989.1 FtsW/RodA/SpoVE family cell cycle protein [Romboutsia timonensis]
MSFENNKTIKNYLNDVVSYIKNKDAHDEVILEVQSHIFDIYYELIDSGNSEEDSINLSISRMGNPKDLGLKLNNIHKASPDYISISLIIGVIAVGLISTLSLASNNLISKSTMLMNILSIIIGSVIAISIYFFDYRKIKNYSYKFYIFTLLIMIALFIIDNLNGYVINGVLALSRKFSLLIVMCFLISLSSIINQLNLSKIKNIFILGVLSFIPFLFQSLIPSLTLSLFYIFTLSFILLRNIDWKKYILQLTIALMGLITITCLFVIRSPYRIRAILSEMPLFFNIPGQELGGGYLQLQSMKLLSKSNILGNGFDSSITNNLPISELSSNLIFTYIVHSFGWFLAIVTVLLMIVFLVRNFIISSKVKDNFGRDIVFLTVTMLSFQFISTILYSIGASALTYGIPFVSIGSVNTLTNCMLIGLLSSVYRRRNLHNKSSLKLI